MSRHFTNEIRVGRSRRDVWTYITNPTLVSRWNGDASEVLQLDEGELGRGSILQIELKNRVIEVAVSYWEPETCFTLTYRSPRFLLETKLRLADGLGVTLVRVDSKLTPLGPWRLAAPMLVMTLRGEAASRLRRLRAQLEGVESQVS